MICYTFIDYELVYVYFANQINYVIIKCYHYYLIIIMIELLIIIHHSMNVFLFLFYYLMTFISKYEEN